MINTTLENRVAILDNEADVIISVFGNLTPEQIVNIREDIQIVTQYFREKYEEGEKDLDFEEFLNKN